MRWIAVSEAAAMLRVSRQQIGRLIATGRLRAERNPLRVDLATIKAYARLSRRPVGRPRFSGPKLHDLIQTMARGTGQT